MIKPLKVNIPQLYIMIADIQTNRCADVYNNIVLLIMPPGTIVPMGAYCFYCVRMYVCTYVRVRLKFLVKVLYWFKLYLMLSKHFRWTVYMLNFDTKINLDEFYF